MNDATNAFSPEGSSPAGDFGRPLLALILADQRRRWQRAERVPVEDYCADRPEFAGDAEVVLQLIYNEVVLREELGEEPRLAEYLGRFPHLAEQLRMQFDVDRALRSGNLFPAIQDGRTLIADGDNPSPMPAAPLRVSGYEILGELGRGGMGVVYKARQTGLKRLVALKMILAGGHGGRQELARFRREAQAIARLQHPNIVQVYEVGEAESGAGVPCPYLVLEFVAGGSLDQKLAGAPLPAREAARLVETLARAIDAVHRQGIVHRDLKPANVLLAADGTPKVSDFGLAKRLELGDEASALLTSAGGTATGQVLGTPSYMAPEQAGGQGAAVGPATDVYALGAILYECLTGRPPFRAALPVDTILQVLYEEAVPPRQLQSGLPRDLETVCLKCLRKEPRRRYESAAALAEDLRRFQAGEPVQARRSGRAERAWRWCRRKPAVAALTVLAGLLLVALVSGSLLAVLLLDQRLERAETAEADLRQSLAAVEKEKTAKTAQLFEANLDRARAERGGGRIGRRSRGLAALKEAARLARTLDLPPARLLELRNEAIACLALVDLQQEHSWQSTDVLIDGGIAFDPHLERYLCIDQQGNMILRSVADNREIRRLRGPAGCSWPVFSPDGRYVACGLRLPQGNLQTGLWDLQRDQAEPARVIEKAAHFHGQLFHPASRFQATQGHDGTIHLYDPATGDLVRRVGKNLPLMHTCAFHPDGRLLACAGENTVRVLDLETGTVHHTLPGDGDAVGVAWRGDGRLLAAGIGLNIHVWDAGAQPPRLVSVLQGHQGGDVKVSFLPGSGLLVSTSWDGTTRLWDPVAGKQLLQASLYLRMVGADGSRLVLSEPGNRWGVYRVAPGRECRVLHPGLVGNRAATKSWVHSVDFSPDGRWLASSTTAGAYFWDAARGSELTHFDQDLATGRFQPKGATSFLSHGRNTLLRWPLRAGVGAPPSQEYLGPPEWLGPGHPDPTAVPAWSHDGEWLAFVQNGRAVVRHAADPTRRYWLGPHPGLRNIALSPDGCWAATSTWQGHDVIVWEVATGRPVHRVKGEHGFAQFSADGRWLATATAVGGRYPCTLWRAGTWEKARALADDLKSVRLAFTPDGKAVALSKALGVVTLVDVTTGRDLAALEAPEVTDFAWFAFSPDGGRLATANMNHTAHLWDLRAVRRQLKEIGLDWEADDLPPAPPEAPPLPLRILGADVADDPAKVHALGLATHTLKLFGNPLDGEAYYRRGLVYVDLKDTARAHDDFSRAIACRHDEPDLFFQRGLISYGRRRWQPALDDFTRVLAKRADHVGAWHYRGHVHEALRRYADAVTDFSAALQRTPRDAHLLECRGMNYRRLGDFPRALADARKAVDLDGSNRVGVHLLARLLALGPAELRDPARALPLARRAVELQPKVRERLHTLGVAQYRLGQYQEALETLGRAVQVNKQTATASELYFLAMCHHRLGDAAKAKECYDGAFAWGLRNVLGMPPDLVRDLLAARAEAAGLLGLDKIRAGGGR